MSLFFVILSIALSGCSPESSQTQKGEDPRNQIPLVSVEGSSTMSRLLKEWADRFMKEHSDIPISLTIDDSADGISALIEGKVDIAAASRELTDEEINLAHVKQVKLKRLAVARDCLVVVVNPKSKINELTLSDVKAIFTGSIVNWKQVGGADKPILVLNREASSGTNRYFKEHVLNGDEYVESAQLEPSSDGLIKKVSSSPDAIGYVGMGHAVKAGSRIKILRLRLINSEGSAVAPSTSSLTDDYPISRPLYLFYDAKSKPSVREFLKFCASDAAQNMVSDTGYVSVKQGKSPNEGAI